jgi:pyruvate ferredoxin oxidoreductase beta subunit
MKLQQNLVFKTVEVARLAVETGAWPLYEVEKEKISFNGISKAILEEKYKPKSLEEWLSPRKIFPFI